LRKYPQSPFPLLTNLERFSNTVGGWNTELQEFGIQSRLKEGDEHLLPGHEPNVGIMVHLAYYGTLSSSGNRYLRHQYSRLESYRLAGRITSYWDLSWTLMRESWLFRTASLCSWKRRWYKELLPRELRSIWKGLNKILNLETLETTISNVWIESPRNKWRQLGIPPKCWRLYFHMLNMFVSYIFEPKLNYLEYDGFIYNRGCKSWWENLLWGDYLQRFNNLVEVDISSGFPNLTRESVQSALQQSGLIPQTIINLILTHLNSPLKESVWFPNVESLIENTMNKHWRISNRSVHMGIGISPILFVITLAWTLTESKIKNPNLVYKFYADDGSFHFNLKGLWTLMRTHDKDIFWALGELLSGENLLVSILNDLPLFQYAGIKFCRKKSSLVKLCGIWIKPFISLGLKLSTPWTMLWQLILHLQDESDQIKLELSGWTRGRGANPISGKPGTEPSRIPLSFWNKTRTKELNLELLILNYRNYFGMILSRLYGPSTTSKPQSPPLKTKPLKGSLLGQLLSVPRHKRVVDLKLDLFNSGSKITEQFLQMNMNKTISLEWKVYDGNLPRKLWVPWNTHKLDWSTINKLDPLKQKEVSSDLNYFRKYSELNIQPDTYLEFKTKFTCSEKNRSR